MLPKIDCETLLAKLLPFAEDQLKKHREFYPFGAVMLEDGSISLTAFHDGNEFPQSQDVIDALIQGHKAEAAQGKIKASGIVWNAGVNKPDGKSSDAIVVSLEHRDNYSVIIVEPYKFGIFKKVSFDDVFAIGGRHNIF